jgi:hypothetical protein
MISPAPQVGVTKEYFPWAGVKGFAAKLSLTHAELPPPHRAEALKPD